MAAERQLAVLGARGRARNSTIRLNMTAPEITRAAVNVAASMSCRPNASRHNKEGAAKASMATTVSKIMRAALFLKIRSRMWSS